MALPVTFTILVITVATTYAFEPQIPDSCPQGHPSDFLFKRGNLDRPRPRPPACTFDLHKPKHQENETRQAMDESVRWPQNTLVYSITEGVFDDCQRGLILEGMREITEKTGCINFREKTPDDVNYLYIGNGGPGTGCWSDQLGMAGGEQNVNLETNKNSCFYCYNGGSVCSGTASHELMHALGLTHEHQRTDRDDYISVVFSNVNPNYTDAFTKTPGQTLIGDYDYASIMHYDQYAFTQTDGQATMIAKDRKWQNIFGKQDHLTEDDVNKLKTYYGCN